MTFAVIGIALLWLAGCCALLGLIYRRTLSARWREPVLCAPVLILESDDWGYGSARQAQALERVADAMARFQDKGGRHPVMTLGVVLAGPDTDRMRAEGCRTYHRTTILDPRLVPVRDAMTRGVARGVFSLQLHGMEHFWPACLLRRATVDDEMRDWLTGPEFPSTEALPAHLQSRWIDATHLPSTALPIGEVAAAASDEVRMFTAAFGACPEVAVPPTFVWTRDVEAAWARAGVGIVVTPGLRYESRDRNGDPTPTETDHFNGATGEHGVLYVVRDSYFEPSLGHSHQRALDALTDNTHLGRPTLLEIHRFNFVGDERATERTLDELVGLLQAACTRFPDMRFMSTAELARHYRDRSPVIRGRIGIRIHYLLRRLAKISRLRKMAWVTGVVLPAWLAYLLTTPRASWASRQLP